MKINGGWLMIFVNNKSIAAATSHTLNINTNPTQTFAKDIGKWGGDSVGNTTWEMSSENLFTLDNTYGASFDDLYELMWKKTPVTLVFAKAVGWDKNKVVDTGGWKPEEGSLLMGDAYITSISVNANTSEIATASISFNGCTAISTQVFSKNPLIKINYSPNNGNYTVYNVTKGEYITNINEFVVDANDEILIQGNCEGYFSGEERFIAQRNETKYFKLKEKIITANLTINVTPEDANIKVTDTTENKVVLATDGAYKIVLGHNVKVVVSKADYNTITDTFIVDKDTNKNYTLSSMYAYINVQTNAVPESNPIVTVQNVSTGKKYTKRLDGTYAVDKDVAIKITVSADGYSSTTIQKVYTVSKTENITLIANSTTVTYTVLPATANISIYNETTKTSITHTGTITANCWDKVRFTATLEDYKDYSKVFTITPNAKFVIEMQMVTYPITVNISNTDNVQITINGQVGKSGEPIEVPKNSNIVILGIKDGYKDLFYSDTETKVTEAKEYTFTMEEGATVGDLLLEDANRVIDSVKQIAKNSNDVTVFGTISDFHGQMLEVTGANGKPFTQNVENVKAGLVLQQIIMGELSKQSNIHTEGVFNTGDIIGRCSKNGVGLDNEKYTYLVQNLDFVNTYNNAYSAKYNNNIPYIFITGNHDAAAFGAELGYSDDNILKAGELFYKYNDRGYAPKFNRAGNTYKVLDKQKLVIAICDPYDYKESKGYTSTDINTMAQEIYDNYITKGYKVIQLSHEPLLESSTANVHSPNYDFWDSKYDYNGKLSTINTSIRFYDIIGANNMIASIHGHNHQDKMAIELGFPQIQNTVVGSLLNGGGDRECWYDGTSVMQYQSDEQETQYDTLAKTSFNIYVWDGQNCKFYQFRVGVGPDIVFERNFNNGLCKITSCATVTAVPTQDTTATGYQMRIIADPTWNAQTTQDVLKVIPDENYHCTAYHFDANMVLKDGVWQNPFVPYGWYYFIVECSGNNHTAQYISNINAPVTERTIYNNSDVVTFTINTDSENTVTINGEQTRSIEVVKGTSVTWAVSRDGYESQMETIIVNGNTTLNITLEKITTQYQVTIVTDGNGTVSLSPQKIENKYNVGTSITVSAVPNNGYVLDHFTMNGTQYDNSFTFNITEDTTINVSFKEAEMLANTLVVDSVPINYIWAESIPDPTTASSVFVKDVSKGVTTTDGTLHFWINNPSQYGIKGISIESPINYSNRGIGLRDFSTYSNAIDNSTCIGLIKGGSKSYNYKLETTLDNSLGAISWGYKDSGGKLADYMPTLLSKLETNITFIK